LPDDEGSYTLDDYKGKQYTFNDKTGKWTESSLGNVNKCIAKWGADVATISWEESSQSWEGFVNISDKAKVQNIPSKINFEIKVGNTTELTANVTISVPDNYTIDTNTKVWLKGGYSFVANAKADRKAVGGSVTISKNGTTIATGSGSVAINDLTDSKNWWTEYYCEGCYEYHEDFNFDYPVDQVKTGVGEATILNIGLHAEGNLRKIIDDSKNIEDTESYDGATLLSNHINSNAAAVLYYLDDGLKIANVKAEPIAYEYWEYECDPYSGQYKEVLRTAYSPMPVLVFADGSKFAADKYFTENAFGDLIEAAEELYEAYASLVE
jgi:hypothetical protein